MEAWHHQSIDEHLDEIFDLARSAARGLGANAFEADEVAQWTCFKLWRRWDHTKVLAVRRIGGARWRAYIRQTARNCHYDLIRKHQRQLARERRAHEMNTGVAVGDGEDQAQRGEPVGVSDVEASLARAEIAALILDLPERQQEVAVRLFLAEMSVAEVADELGLKPQTVRKHARNARAAIKDKLLESTEPQPL